MSELSHKDFTAFFQAVWGVDPFPWQADLLTRLATGEDPRRTFAGSPGEWPAVLDLPTGSGKTAALDIALFHLALEAGLGEKRRAPVRIALVVDRRLIVDDAHARARTLARKLADAIDNPTDADAIVLKVANALRDLAGAGQPLLVARRLRGGTPREDDWARTPMQPTILCSTVDQVGSRLLFRGYGVSDSMKPVHAGLLGSDCLILLDEAHLSEPFRQTLEAVQRLRGADSERAPFGFAVLTATPRRQEEGEEKEPPFALSKVDEAHKVLARRIEAPKPARLVEIAGKQGVDTDSRRADAVAEEAIAVLGRLQASGIAHPAVGLVLNRVARARTVFERIRGELKDAARVILLIGPARAVDRDALAQELEPIRTGRDDARQELNLPFIVVATQTIEAGVDIDFDGLVTEAAALDALRQRFGRLNRAGRDIAPEAAILVHKDDIGSKADDPVYGDRLKATWNALQELAGSTNAVDFGVRALRDRIGERAAELAAPAKDAPVLMPAYAHLWSQTAPIPNADPEVALFLHGPDRSPASVQIVWRADIDEERDLRPAMGAPAEANVARERLIELLKLVPPRAVEAIEVPLWAARAWLDRSAVDQAGFADVAARLEDRSEAQPVAARRAFLWVGEDSARTGSIYGRALRNGDLLVVPAAYGGCDRWGWKPQSEAPVIDVADKAAASFAAHRFAVRVTPELAAQELLPQDGATGSDLAVRLAATLAEHREERADRLLAALLGLGLPPEITGRLECLNGVRGVQRSFAYGDADAVSHGVVLFVPRGLKKIGETVELSATPSTESEETSAVYEEPLGLAAHCREARKRTAAFGAAGGLPRSLAEDIALAALLHDTGKADRRYQAYFAGGDPYGPDLTEPLAKTGQRRPPPGAWDRAGLPPHWRHEALSVRAAIAHPDFKQAHDRLLVLWLIGTHHGHGRPLFPHADPAPADGKGQKLCLSAAPGGELLLKDEPGPQSLAFNFEGLDWAQIFDALKERYGIWGLARLEAFVRLADHRASEAGAPPEVAQQRKEAAE